MLIIISNPSLLNPGPVRTRPLTILYKNVQGLINTNDLASETPPLNMTKLLEFHGYLYTHKPDILILNETWLKKTIEDNELLPSSYNYNIIRVDRSSKTHPYDPKFPKKFRKNGGVLIAHRTDIDISVSKLSLVSCQAELLSVVIKFPNDGNCAYPQFTVLAHWVLTILEKSRNISKYWPRSRNLINIFLLVILILVKLHGLKVQLHASCTEDS